MTQAAILAASGSPGTTTGFKNRIINGNMVVNQYAQATPYTPTDGKFSLDRWKNGMSANGKYTTQISSSAPAGFTNSLLITSTSAYSLGSSDEFEVYYNFEGYNVADLGYGTANSRSATLSFWAQSSLTGTFGGCLVSTTAAYSFPFSYTITAANTWTYFTVTVTPQTSGTWNITNGTGLQLFFSLGAGSANLGTANAWVAANLRGVTGQVNLVSNNAATLSITGVQLEVGTTATNFDFRSYGTELALCQRYAYMHISGISDGTAIANGNNYVSSYAQGVLHFPVTMRTKPSLTATSGTTYYGFSRNSGNNNLNSISLDSGNTSSRVGWIYNASEVSGTAGNAGIFYTQNASASLLFSAEL